MDTLITHSLRGEGFDASEDGAGRGTPLIPVCIQNATRGDAQNGLGVSEDGVMYTLDQGSQHAVAFRAAGQDGFTPSDISPPISATDGGGAGVPTIAFDCKASGRGGFSVGEVSPTLRSMGDDGSNANGGGRLP
jgi:DNA (cytosine-5)-methyltransferase 1